MKIKVCAKCGVEFVCPPGSGNSTTKYCSEHRTTNPRNRKHFNCVVCGADIMHRTKSAKYCSTECLNTARRVGRRTMALDGEICGITDCSRGAYSLHSGDLYLCGSHSRSARHYNIDANYLWLLYEFGCRVCGRVDVKSMNIDHDHSCCPKNKKSCGKCVRGVLCRDCNLGLGYFKDDIDLLKRAIKYLDISEDNKRIIEGKLF